MRGYRAAEHEPAELHAALCLARPNREACRINAAIFVGRVRKTADLADALLIDADTVRDYVKRNKKTLFQSLQGN